jgi:hypothetical protein
MIAPAAKAAGPASAHEAEGGPQVASIQQRTELAVSADTAWAAMRAVGDAHTLFAPVLEDANLQGDTRTVRFANGMVLHERILNVDEATRRVAYTALDGPGMTYHHASMQIVDDGPGRSTFVWITDFLPADVAGALAPLIEQGTRALKANLERS